MKRDLGWFSRRERREGGGEGFFLWVNVILNVKIFVLQGRISEVIEVSSSLMR